MRARPVIRFVGAGVLALVLDTSAIAADEAITAPHPSPEVKQIFASQCSWCHGAWGMKADKGPRLAGTKMTEQQVEERIRNGKPGYMPAFRKTLSDDEIKMMAQYIKSLKVQE